MFIFSYVSEIGQRRPRWRARQRGICASSRVSWDMNAVRNLRCARGALWVMSAYQSMSATAVAFPEGSHSRPSVTPRHQCWTLGASSGVLALYPTVSNAQQDAGEPAGMRPPDQPGPPRPRPGHRHHGTSSAWGPGGNVAARSKRPRAEPMTFGKIRENGVRSLLVSCWICDHQAVLSAAHWPDDDGADVRPTDG